MSAAVKTIIALLSIFLWAPPGWQEAALRSDVKLLKCVTAYRAAAEEYRADHVDTAAQTLAHLDPSELRRVLAGLKTMRNGAFVPFVWDRPLLLAAGMLHVDVAIAEHKQGRHDQFRLHTDFAAAAFEAADLPRAGTDETAGTAARRSSLAIARMLLGNGSTALGRQYIEAAMIRFPGDPQFLATAGTLNESDATQRMLPELPFNDTAVLEQVRSFRDQRLNEAAQLFERALAADPALVEGRIRLAHVRTLQHDDPAALLLLNQALAAQPPPPWIYLARLMLGGVQERAGQVETARQLYLAAIAIQPEGQSAFIALGQALHAAGDRRGAADVLARLFARRLTPSADDPWWDYPFGRWRDAEPMLAGLRAEARQ